MIRPLLFSVSVAVLSAQSPGTFTATGNLITAEGSPQATLLSNGKVLITGNSAELYDPVSGSFSPTGAIESRAFNSCTLLADGRVLIAGGASPAGVASASAELYDPTSGIFTPTGNMTTPREGHHAVLLNTGKVLIVGGETTGGPVSAELFDQDSGTFTATGPLPGAAGETDTATLLADGRVLIVTYYSGLAGLYDPATGTFSAIGPGPGTSTATLLANGKVLFVGGTGDDGSSNRASLLDPATGSFSETGFMSASRLGQSATLQGDLTVLIAGGQVCPGRLDQAQCLVY